MRLTQKQMHEDWLKSRGLHESQLKSTRIIDVKGKRHDRAPNEFPDLSSPKRFK